MATKTQDTYDVLVVGSGASGGWAAKRLAEAGVKVALVDAGRPLRITDLNEHGSGLELPYRGVSAEVVKKTRPIQKDCYACTERNYDWFANDLEEPYTTAPGKPFSWQGRMRVTGGRTVVWGRQSYRMGDFDLKSASTDGFGMDWPLSYADLAPYYDQVEDYVGISGLAEGAYELPDSKFLPAMPFKCGERRLRERVKSKLGWTVTMGRVGEPHPLAERAGALPLLRPLLLGLRHQLVLQLGVHDGGRRDRERQLHPRAERDGLQGADRRRQEPRDRSALHRPRHARGEGDPRARGGAVRAGARVGADPVQLEERAEPRRPRQLERCPRPLPDGPPVGRGRRERRVPRARGEAVARRPEPAERHLRDPLPEREERPEVEGVPARLRLPGRPGHGLQLRRAGLRRHLQARGQEPGVERAARGLRRVPALLRELRRDRPVRPGGHVRDPDPQGQHGLGRQRAQDDPRHGGLGGRDDGRGRRQEHRAVRLHRPRSRLRHPRARRRAHGPRQEDVGAQPVPAGARRRRTCS